MEAKKWMVVPYEEDYEKILFKSRKPKKIHADQGSEFFNKDCEKYLKQNNISLYFINSEVKAAVVERFNRTLKERMWRYFTFSKSKKYIDILEDLVNSYNKTYHRSIKTAPDMVNNKNSEEIFINLYGFKDVNKP